MTMEQLQAAKRRLILQRQQIQVDIDLLDIEQQQLRAQDAQAQLLESTKKDTTIRRGSVHLSATIPKDPEAYEHPSPADSMPVQDPPERQGVKAEPLVAGTETGQSGVAHTFVVLKFTSRLKFSMLISEHTYPSESSRCKHKQAPLSIPQTQARMNILARFGYSVDHAEKQSPSGTQNHAMTGRDGCADGAQIVAQSPSSCVSVITSLGRSRMSLNDHAFNSAISADVGLNSSSGHSTTEHGMWQQKDRNVPPRTSTGQQPPSTPSPNNKPMAHQQARAQSRHPTNPTLAAISDSDGRIARLARRGPPRSPDQSWDKAPVRSLPAESSRTGGLPINVARPRQISSFEQGMTSKRQRSPAISAMNEQVATSRSQSGESIEVMEDRTVRQFRAADSALTSPEFGGDSNAHLSVKKRKLTVRPVDSHFDTMFPSTRYPDRSESHSWRSHLQGSGSPESTEEAQSLETSPMTDTPRLRRASRPAQGVYYVGEFRRLSTDERSALELRYCAHVAKIIAGKPCVDSPPLPLNSENLWTRMCRRFSRKLANPRGSGDTRYYRNAQDFEQDVKEMLQDYIRMGPCRNCPFAKTGNSRVMCWRVRLESVLDEQMRGLRRCLKECEEGFVADDVTGRRGCIDKWFKEGGPGYEPSE